MLLPTVVVCCHGDAGIAQACLLGKDDLWNSGHIDDISAPLTEHQTLCPRGESGPLDAQHGSSGVALDPQAPRHLQQNLQRHKESEPSGDVGDFFLLFIMTRRPNTRLSGPVAEGLSHGDVAHSCRTGGLSVIEGLNPPGGPGKNSQTGN